MPRDRGINALLSRGISLLVVFVWFVVVLFFYKVVFTGIAPGYLFLALIFIPMEVFFANVGYVLLGA